MEETLVSFKLAKLAKKAGFKDVINTSGGKHYYNYKGKLDGDVTEELRHNINKDDKSDIYDSIPAPTLSLLQKWLREVHNIDISIYWCTIFGATKWTYSMTKIGVHSDYDTHGEFDSYEKTLEVGEIEACRRIISNKLNK